MISHVDGGGSFRVFSCSCNSSIVEGSNDDGGYVLSVDDDDDDDDDDDSSRKKTNALSYTGFEKLMRSSNRAVMADDSSLDLDLDLATG